MISLRIPPIPVPAPPYGSIAEGWLWLSIPTARAYSSVIDTIPASSPGPNMMFSPSVGNCFKNLLLLLYEQCSENITSSIPSSKEFIFLFKIPSIYSTSEFSKVILTPWFFNKYNNYQVLQAKLFVNQQQFSLKS